MEGATEKAIKKYCESMFCEFVGVIGGVFTFRDRFGDDYTYLSQKELLKKADRF